MNCPSCGSENRDGNLFCNKCGGKLETVSNSFAEETSELELPPVDPEVSPFKPIPQQPQQPQYQAPQPQYQATQPQPQYQATQPQPQYQYQATTVTPVQQVAAVPVVPTQTYIGVVPVKAKKRFCLFTFIATVIYIISFFIPLVSYRGIDGGSLFDALSGVGRMFGMFGGDPTGFYIIVGALGLALLFGLIDSFCNTRALSILGGLIIIGFVVLFFGVTGMGGDFFEIAGIGYYGFAVSGLLMFIGGCSGV